MKLRLFAIPPRAVRHLSGTTEEHRRARGLSVIGTINMLRGAREHGRSEHVGIVNRNLCIRNVAQAKTGASFFPRQLQNPIANAARDFEEARFAGLLPRFEKNLTDETRPDNRRLVRGNAAATAGEIKMIAPTEKRRRR